MSAPQVPDAKAVVDQWRRRRVEEGITQGLTVRSATLLRESIASALSEATREAALEITYLKVQRETLIGKVAQYKRDYFVAHRLMANLLAAPRLSEKAVSEAQEFLGRRLEKGKGEK